MKSIGRVVGLMLVALMISVSANATVLDLATSSNGTNPDILSGTINGAIFEWTDFTSTGTGLIDTFAQVQARNTEEAYNTTENNTLDNGSSDVFNHALPLTSLPTVNRGGVDYYEFLLDINEPSSQSSPYLTLDEIQVIQSNVLNPSTEVITGGLVQIPGALVYRLDSAAADNRVELNASLNTGSGSGDMFLYIPTANFTNSYQYVYLYSSFGNPNTSEGGFEEWAVRLQPTNNEVVPEPATMSLVGLGLAGMVARKLRKRA